MEQDWLKFKKYPHIGEPLGRKDTGWIRKYVTNPNRIAEHKFLPLLHRVINQRKFRPIENAAKNSSGKRTRAVGDKKQRHIYFPSHLDSIIYSYYSYLLSKSYEEYLLDKPFASVAVAYRRIAKGNGQNGNKCNIEFSFEAFEFIEKNKDRKLSVIVADVTSFFDNLNHRLLHKRWKQVLNMNDLPRDHYALYRNLVLKKYVNEKDLFNKFCKKLIVERFEPNDDSIKKLRRKHVRKIYHMRKERVVSFCNKKDFFNSATNLIHVDKPLKNTKRKENGKEELKGIPQGTPISATLANIYMVDFDERIYEAISNSEKNGFYQRYSDDLIIICDQKDEEYFCSLIKNEIEINEKLEIQTRKTNIYRYELNGDSEFTGGIVQDSIVNPNKQLEYLGFMYDGSKVRVKTSGFSKFYRSMKRSFRRGANFAKKASTPTNKLYEARLYKRYTYVGSKRRLRWLSDPESSTGYKRSTQYDWGNFISYLKKANDVMRKINNDDSIKKQYSKIWKKFHELKKLTKEKIASNEI